MARRRAQRILTVAAALVVSACAGPGLRFDLTKALWEPDLYVDQVDPASCRLKVDGIRVSETPDGSTMRVLVKTHLDRRQVTGALAPEVTEPCWFSLAWPEDGAMARAMAELLATQPIGAIDRCAIEASWILTAQDERNWEGRVEVHGELAPALCRSEVGEDAAKMLLASPLARVPNAEDVTLARCIAAAAHVDWQILVPDEGVKTGEVVGCIARAPAGGTDLLVRAGRNGSRWLRVPAEAMPVLMFAHRDPHSLFDRFVVQTYCQARFAVPQGPGPLQAPPPGTTLVFHSSWEELVRYRSLLKNILLTPFAVLGDIGKWFWQHGPMQLIWPIPESEPPPRRPK